jgi:hypothetical protein
MTHGSGWGAVVRGDLIDLQIWADELEEPSEPWIETHEDETVLRSASFHKSKSAAEVGDRATICIDRLNGLLALTRDARPLRFDGAVIRIDAEGHLHRTLLVEPGQYSIRGARARFTVRGADGMPVPPAPPQESEVQKWTKLADSDEWLEDALIYFGRATNWFDIYKALECVMKRFAGEHKFVALGWPDASKVDRLKRTANWFRHAKLANKPHPDPMKLPEARLFVGQLLRRALAEAASSGP